jgi:hypothetical protein
MVSSFLEIFKKWGTGSLVASTAIPFPFPTSLVFAAAGASDYHLGRFLAVVSASRIFRYTAIALVADSYGRRFLGMLRHPTQYWGWLLLFAVFSVVVIGAGIQFNRRLAHRRPFHPDGRKAADGRFASVNPSPWRRTYPRIAPCDQLFPLLSSLVPSLRRGKTSSALALPASHSRQRFQTIQHQSHSIAGPLRLPYGPQSILTFEAVDSAGCVHMAPSPSASISS